MSVDALLVARGAAAGLLLAVPAAMVSVVLSDQEERSEGLLALAYVVVVAGFLLAGFAASAAAAHEHRRHGLAAALVAYVPVQVIGVLGRLDRGDDFSIVAVVVLLAFAVLAGNSGALLGTRRQTRRSTP